MKLSKKEIEEIIQDEITVDAYGDEVKWINGKSSWEKVNVIGEESYEDIHNGLDYYVEIEFKEIVFSVKLNKLRKCNADELTQRAIIVWSNRKFYY